MSKGKALSVEELEFIKVHLLDMTIKEIADALGRNYYTIYNLNKKAGIERNHFFTPQEDAYIRQNYSKMPVERIGTKLGVSAMSIYNRARKLGIVKNQKRSEVS